jgi:hypothetical protein
MAQCAEDEVRFDTRPPHGLTRLVLYNPHHILRRQARRRVQEGSKANLGVNNAVHDQLVHHVVDAEPQGVFCLQQGHAARGTREEVRQVRALGGRDELPGVELRRDGRGQLPHRVEAQRAIQVHV